MEKYKNFFTKNLDLKIISLVIAIILWIVSMNINNPLMTETYTVPMTLLNLSHVNDSGMVILNEADLSKQEVYIKIKATRNDLISLDTSRIKATIDFSPVDITNTNNIGKSVPVSVYVSVPSISYEIVDYSPKTVDVVFDQLITKDIPIELKQSGTPSGNYEITGTPTVSPEVVTVKGAKTYVDQISNAEVTVDLNGATAPISDQFDIHLYDTDKKDVTESFSLSSNTANVNINISRTDSLAIDTPTWEGEPAEGYKVVDISWTPKYVDAIGDENTISAMKYLTLPPVNVSGATTDVVTVYNLNDLLKDQDISIQAGAEDECTVTVKIEKVITKSVDVSIDNIKFVNITEEQQQSLNLPSTIKVNITGPTSEIEIFDPSTISGVADFTNFAEGDMDIEVDVTCTNPQIEVETPVRLTLSE